MIAAERPHAEHPFVGRNEELAFLERLTSGALPSVTFVHGIGGLGKTRLLDVFAQQRRAAGVVVIRIDGRDVEPTENGFLRELGSAAGGEITSSEQAATRLGALGALIIVDDCDALRLLDTWLRRTFIPSLPANVHVVFSGRDAPVSAWLQMPWRGEFRILELTPLAEAESVALLASAGVDLDQAARVNRIARGHPLALRLAALTLRKADDASLEEIALHRVIDELARRRLSEITDPVTRRAVEAASVVRSGTGPLLGAMLPDVAPADAYERLRSLPLIRISREGLELHDTVRDAIAAELRASDPPRYLRYRRACWASLIRDVKSSAPSDLWRYTADLLYLLENPVVREAFFPSGSQPYAVEPARHTDSAAVLAITEHHDGPEGAQTIADWLTSRPDAFYVARDRGGYVAGYYLLFDAAICGESPASADPIVRRWLDHIAQHPVEPGETILFLRRWLSRNEGEPPCPVQAACWLDIKRAYMVKRPYLRRVYVSLRDPAPYAAAVTQLGFSILEECETALGGRPYITAMLDFGPGSVDGWFAKLVAAELGIVSSDLLDLGARELVVGSRREALTPREFETFQYLVQRVGSVVRREDVLSDVWGTEAEVGSNVVDVVIRSLRKKLGERANTIETVSGLGYRFRER
jgi:hypothetical protein